MEDTRELGHLRMNYCKLVLYSHHLQVLVKYGGLLLETATQLNLNFLLCQEM